MIYVKSKDWLKEKLHDKNIKIVDCTYSLNDSSYGFETYKDKHIPGAVFFDLADDLSGNVQSHGGRHPLPEIGDFQNKLEKAGINEAVTVIAYDGGEGCFASRLWWLLKYLGHPNVFVLDGGMKEWDESGLPTTDHLPVCHPVEFNIRLNQSMVAHYPEVAAKIDDPQTILIDSRAKERFLGLVEPLDTKPGHIPGALNYEWTEGFTNGKWKNSREQQERFSNLNPKQELIVYCGSGVTATPNIIALLESGFKKVKLYSGSYSDWVSYPENKIETGE